MSFWLLLFVKSTNKCKKHKSLCNFKVDLWLLSIMFNDRKFWLLTRYSFAIFHFIDNIQAIYWNVASNDIPVKVVDAYFPGMVFCKTRETFRIWDSKRSWKAYLELFWVKQKHSRSIFLFHDILSGISKFYFSWLSFALVSLVNVKSL